MPKQVDVLVRDISRDEQGRLANPDSEPQTLSYKSFLILNDPESPRFELLGEVESIDKDGNVKLRPGNPNLQAQHRSVVQPKRNAEPVVNPGPTAKELEQQAEIDKLKQQLAEAKIPAAPKEKKRPGPKSKAEKEKALEGATV